MGTKDSTRTDLLPFLAIPLAGLVCSALLGADRFWKCAVAAGAGFFAYLCAERLPEILRQKKDRGRGQLRRLRRCAGRIRNKAVREEIRQILQACRLRLEKNSPASPERQRDLTAQTLPALLRLTETYRALERHPLRGLQMEQAMRQIEEELEKIRTACQRDCDGDHLLTLLDTSAELSFLKKTQKEN